MPQLLCAAEVVSDAWLLVRLLAFLVTMYASALSSSNNRAMPSWLVSTSAKMNLSKALSSLLIKLSKRVPTFFELIFSACGVKQKRQFGIYAINMKISNGMKRIEVEAANTLRIADCTAATVLERTAKT